MARLLSLGLLLLAALPGLAQEGATGGDAPAAENSAGKVVSAAKADATTAGDQEFKPPPGFKTKKRGDIVLYCMKDSTVGTRFKTEKCFDEAQMREYLLALEIQKRDIDRVRSTCGTGASCASQ